MKRCVMFTVMVCLSFTTASRALPPDQPDIVTIDGSPCNRPCQAYMEWSRRLLNRSARDSADSPSQVTAPAAARPKPAVHDRIAKPRVARTEANRPAAMPKLPAPLANSPAAANATPADTSRAKPLQAPDTRNPQGAEKAPTKAFDSAHLSPSGPNHSETSGAEMANAKQTDELSSHAEFGSGADSLPRSIRAQVIAAAAVAERSTPAAILLPDATSASSVDSKADESTGPNAEMPVALVISHSEIKSVSELTGRNIAIDDRQSASELRVTAALVAAGATEIQLRDGATLAIDRLLRGEVPAAVVALVSPEAAAAFPDIAGFHVFKIPLASR
ncbi:hypothetical protein [Bradyrhizobium sp.]|uniref:hypothetical protein n=1 Tax=Bradyrhizobium sp. TaxID=376 RepID=UPI002BD008FC|nr:hypothetical protein [Bradyrhizobium sp.]HWX58867.1 hypothetical protein [Bradyrhizobium sp.]